MPGLTRYGLPLLVFNIVALICLVCVSFTRIGSFELKDENSTSSHGFSVGSLKGQHDHHDQDVMTNGGFASIIERIFASVICLGLVLTMATAFEIASLSFDRFMGVHQEVVAVSLPLVSFALSVLITLFVSEAQGLLFASRDELLEETNGGPALDYAILLVLCTVTNVAMGIARVAMHKTGKTFNHV